MAEALQNKGYDADWLNGDLEQRERERVMARTREGKLRFLVATDVAARGIDISHLTHVINFDFPETAEYYVHRTGRTGRAGRTGTAISLVGPKDIGSLYLLRLTYKIRPIEKPSCRRRGAQDLRQEADLVGMFQDAFLAGRAVHPDDLALARRLLTLADSEKIIAGLLRDHLGARATDPATEAAEAAPERRTRRPTSLPRPLRLPRGTRRAGRSRPARRRLVGLAPRRSRSGRAGVTRSVPDPHPSRAGPSRAARSLARPRAGPIAQADRPPPELRSRPGRSRPTARPSPARPGGRVPHSTYVTWEPRPRWTTTPTHPGRSRARREEARAERAPARREPKEPAFDTSPTIAAPPPEATAPPPAAPWSTPWSRAPSRPATEPRPTTRTSPQIFINVGRRDGARVADFQRLL